MGTGRRILGVGHVEDQLVYWFIGLNGMDRHKGTEVGTGGEDLGADHEGIAFLVYDVRFLL